MSDEDKQVTKSLKIADFMKKKGIIMHVYTTNLLLPRFRFNSPLCLSVALNTFVLKLTANSKDHELSRRYHRAVEKMFQLAFCNIKNFKTKNAVSTG